MIIEELLKRKQKKFPRAVYVKDKKKVLVEKWGLADDSYDVLIFDRKGKLLYSKSGKMSPAEIEKAVAMIDRVK
jgi:predicted transcriptional regulator